jgi:hypothetical protein
MIELHFRIASFRCMAVQPFPIIGITKIFGSSKKTVCVSIIFSDKQYRIGWQKIFESHKIWNLTFP